MDEPRAEKIGSYRLGPLLGQGAMASVREAIDEQTGEIVAIKLLETEPGDADALARIDREAAALRKIQHPHVARLIDSGATEQGRPYLVFELVRGRTLLDYLRDRVPIDHERLLAWMIEAAGALDEAWKHHIIHRDIKPANMIVEAGGALKVLDFGLAKAVYQDLSLTSERAMLGTPRYLSPEMGLGQSLDFRADMYSLGATFYHLFTGQSPFEAETAVAMAMKHAQAPLVPPHVADPSVPHDVSAILTRMLAKDPAGRYPTYADLIADLKEARLAAIARARARDPHAAPAPEEEKFREAPSAREHQHGPLTDAERRARALEVKIQETSAWGQFKARAGLAAASLALGAALVLAAQALIPGLEDEAPPEKRSAFARLNPARWLGAGAGRPPDPYELVAENRGRMEAVMSAILRAEAASGAWPKSLVDLAEAGETPVSTLLDAWGNPWVYRRGARTLLSAGADGLQGTRDDCEIDSRMQFVKEPTLPPEAEGGR